MSEATSGTTFYFKATFRPTAVIFMIFFYPFYQLILHLAENDRNQNNDGVSKINVYFSFTLKDVQR